MTHNEKVAIKRLSDIKRYAVYLEVEDRYALDIAIRKLEQDAIPMSVVEDIKAEIQAYRNNNSIGEYDKIFELCLLIIDEHINGKESEDKA